METKNPPIKATEFKVEPTVIPGLLIIHMNAVEDERGSFQEKFQKQKLAALGFPADFVPVQQNVSYNRQAGVTRGFHAEPWDKFVSVIKGKVFAAYVDLRSQNFGQKIEVTIDANSAVFVPRGVGNSFQTLEPDTYYSYLLNDHWTPELAGKYKAVNLADASLNIRWPIPLAEAIVSDKDRTNPALQEVTPF